MPGLDFLAKSKKAQGKCWKSVSVKISYLGRRRAGCQVAVEFFDPDNHMLEIYWGIDRIGTNENARPAEEWREELTLEAAVDNAPPGQDTTMMDPLLRKD